MNKPKKKSSAWGVLDLFLVLVLGLVLGLFLDLYLDRVLGLGFHRRIGPIRT